MGRTRRQLTRRARKGWLLAHVALSVGWMGAGAANLTLAASAALRPAGRLTAESVYLAVHLIDLWVVIPAAFGALGTGVVLSVGTPWGLFTHWWVTSKLALTLAVITFSTFGLGLWVETAIAAGEAGQVTAQAPLIVVGAAANIVAFLVMTALSVYKPRGKLPRPGSR